MSRSSLGQQTINKDVMQFVRQLRLFLCVDMIIENTTVFTGLPKILSLLLLSSPTLSNWDFSVQFGQESLLQWFTAQTNPWGSVSAPKETNFLTKAIWNPFDSEQKENEEKQNENTHYFSQASLSLYSIFFVVR